MSAHKIYAPKGVGAFMFAAAYGFIRKTSAAIRNANGAAAPNRCRSLWLLERLASWQRKDWATARSVWVFCETGLKRVF